MKFGCFAFSAQIETVEKLGYDCIELDLGEIVAMNEEEFAALKERVAASKLGFEVFSGLLPLTVRFHAKDFDEEYWMNYVDIAARRAAALGAVMIPLGAGKCRSIPDDCQDIPAAKAYVLHLVQRIADIVGKYGIMLVVEPLGPANSNYINTIPDAVEFISAVNRPNCQTMCDLRHMHKLSESFDHIPEYAAPILHAHIDYPYGMARLFPQKEDDYDYLPYFQALRKSNYDRILTIEATSYEDFAAEAGSALQYLHELEAAAK